MRIYFYMGGYLKKHIEENKQSQLQGGIYRYIILSSLITTNELSSSQFDFPFPSPTIVIKKKKQSGA